MRLSHEDCAITVMEITRKLKGINVRVLYQIRLRLFVIDLTPELEGIIAWRLNRNFRGIILIQLTPRSARIDKFHGPTPCIGVYHLQ